MASVWDKLQEALRQAFAVPVYYFASTEQPLLREAAAAVRLALLEAEGDAESTLVEGPTPDLGELVAAAGTISFFGTPRVVELRELSPAAMGEKDAAELADLFSDLENAVLIVTALHKDKKAAASKKAKLLFEAARQVGFAAELEKPTRRENLEYLNKLAAQEASTWGRGAAEALLDRAGEDRTLLAAETARLAALAGYGEIGRPLVERYSAANIEADVFELARHITARRRRAAFEKLGELLALRHEPIAIAAALAGTFVDMYRVRVGSEQNKTVGRIFDEMGYKGNDWRLKKAKENAAPYSTAQLEACLLCLAGLDRSLKSSALPDKSVLLEAAVGELMRIEAGR